MQTEYHFDRSFSAPDTVEDTIAALAEFFGWRHVSRSDWSQWTAENPHMQARAEFVMFKNDMIWPLAAGLRGTLVAFPGATWISITDGKNECAIDASVLLSPEFAEGWDFRNSEPDYSLIPEADETDANDLRNWALAGDRP